MAPTMWFREHFAGLGRRSSGASGWSRRDSVKSSRRRSGDDRLGPMLKVVADAEPDRLVHRHGLDLSRGEEPDLGGLVAGGQLATDSAAGEADRELLADLTVGVLDHVPWVGVDADDCLGHDLKTFFFSGITEHTICYRDWSSDVCSSD